MGLFPEVETQEKKKNSLFPELDAQPEGSSLFPEVDAGADLFPEIKANAPHQLTYQDESALKTFARGLPGVLKETGEEAAKDTAAAAAYELAGGVKGLTLGYVDPTKQLEKTPL